MPRGKCRLQKQCVQCGGVFEAYAGTTKYCSAECHLLAYTKRGGPNNPSCLMWTGSKKESGYGLLWLRGYTRRQAAHRVSYRLFNGPIPDGMIVCHSCDTPACVEPSHLFLGTHLDNKRDSIAKGRHRPGGVWHVAKLTEDQVRAIRADQRCYSTIASEYGVTTANIYSIRKRRSWKHLT
jgi:hypothetical protein